MYLIFPKTALPALEFHNHKTHRHLKLTRVVDTTALMTTVETTDNFYVRQNEGQKVVKVIPVSKNLIF